MYSYLCRYTMRVRMYILHVCLHTRPYFPFLFTEWVQKNFFLIHYKVDDKIGNLANKDFFFVNEIPFATGGEGRAGGLKRNLLLLVCFYCF